MRNKFIVCGLLFIVMLSGFNFVVGCDAIGLGQEIDSKIISFQANRQPPDISRVEFLVNLERTERTVSGVNYTIALVVDGKLLDSKTVTTSSKEKWGTSIELIGHGAGMNRMLSALEKKYEEAQSNYDDFMNEQGWDLLRGELFDKSYDEIKKLQEKETQLKTEINKWKYLRVGNGVNWGTSLDDFCKNYLEITVEKEQ